MKEKKKITREGGIKKMKKQKGITLIALYF